VILKRRERLCSKKRAEGGKTGKEASNRIKFHEHALVMISLFNEITNSVFNEKKKSRST